MIPAALGWWTTLSKAWAPAAVAGGTTLLAIDSTQVSVAAIALVQAVIVALVGWQQVRNRTRAEDRAARQDRESAITQAKIQGTDRLIDQLQEQATRADQARAADRDLIATLQREVGTLTAEMLKLNRRHTAALMGTDRLIDQLTTAGIEPVWRPADLED